MATVRVDTGGGTKNPSSSSTFPVKPASPTSDWSSIYLAAVAAANRPDTQPVIPPNKPIIIPSDIPTGASDDWFSQTPLAGLS